MSSCLRLVRSLRILSCAVKSTLTDSVSTLKTSSSSSGGVGLATGFAAVFSCAPTCSPSKATKPTTAAINNKTMNPPFLNIFKNSPVLFQRVANRSIACLRPQLILASPRRVGEPHLDLPLASIVILVRRAVRQHVLRPQLLRDPLERSLKRKHVAGEESFAAGLLAKSGQILVALVFDRTGFNTRYCSEKAGLGRDAKNCSLGPLRDIDRVFDLRAAESVVAVGDDHDDSTTGDVPKLLVGEL